MIKEATVREEEEEELELKREHYKPENKRNRMQYFKSTNLTTIASRTGPRSSWSKWISSMITRRTS